MGTRISSIVIHGFRGIKNGVVEGFKNLNIIIGRNGSGKSSLLEALYIGASAYRDVVGINPIHRICTRHGWIGGSSVLSLFYRGFSEPDNAFNGFKIHLVLHSHNSEDVIVKHVFPSSSDLEVLEKRGLDVNKVVCLSVKASGFYNYTYRLYMDDSGRYNVIEVEEFKGKSISSIFIDWVIVESYGEPEEIYSLLINRYGIGFKKQLIKVLRNIAGIESVEPLKEAGRTILYAVFSDYAMPIYYLSDGVKYTLINLLLLLSVKKGVIFIEEPEVHQHYRLLKILTKAMVDSIKDLGNQVFVSTHSLEFIDLLVDMVKKHGLENETSFYRLRLDDGVLKASCYEFSVVEKLRKDIEYDFRG